MVTPLFNYIRLWSLLISCMTLAGFSTSCTPKSAIEVKPGNQPEMLVLKKITSGTHNAQTYTYSAQGLLTNFQSNWVYDDSLGTRSTTHAEFDYDSQHRLSQIRANGQFMVKFFYDGNLFDKTDEYDHKNRLVATHFYLFNPEGQLVELLDQIHDPHAETKELDSFIKFRYEYDNQKNVQRVHSFIRNPGDSSFKAWQSVYYENYDNKKNPNNLLPHYPYIAQSCTQVNNPGKIITKHAADQSIISVVAMAYIYSAQGYPTRKTIQATTTRPLLAITVDYQYE